MCINENDCGISQRAVTMLPSQRWRRRSNICLPTFIQFISEQPNNVLRCRLSSTGGVECVRGRRMDERHRQKFAYGEDWISNITKQFTLLKLEFVLRSLDFFLFHFHLPFDLMVTQHLKQANKREKQDFCFASKKKSWDLFHNKHSFFVFSIESRCNSSG